MLGLVICGVERMCCFLIWVAYTHRKLEPGLHLNWFSIDIVGIIIPMALRLECFLWFYILVLSSRCFEKSNYGLPQKSLRKV
jgi:hypothetical protein